MAYLWDYGTQICDRTFAVMNPINMCVITAQNCKVIFAGIGHANLGWHICGYESRSMYVVTSQNCKVIFVGFIRLRKFAIAHLRHTSRMPYIDAGHLCTNLKWM
jgi:hypothetical protein